MPYPPQLSETAARLGLHRAGREWRGKCPCCGYPTAFVLSVGHGGRPIGWCSSCQDKAGIAAVLSGADGHQSRPASTAPGKDDAAARACKTERARALWNGAEPVSGTPAERYLDARGVLDWWRLGERIAREKCGAEWVALRYRENTPHPSGRGRLPALLAAVRNARTGELQAIHRTYLRRDGAGKADVEPAKASLGPTHGGAVMLWPPVGDEPLVIGEGIESSLAAGKLCNAPCWSAISAGNLARSLVLPDLAGRDVIITVDRDPAGERAAREAAWRWQREGRRVRLLLPDAKDTDANDVLRERDYA